MRQSYDNLKSYLRYVLIYKKSYGYLKTNLRQNLNKDKI